MRLLIKRILSLVPTRLPVGMAELDIYCDEVIELTGPLADRDSMIFVIATTIMHLGPQRSHVPKNYFVRTLLVAAAKQLSSQAFQDVKQRQAEAAEQAKLAATQSEATEKVPQMDGQKTGL